MKRRYRTVLLIALPIVLVDQLTKWLVTANFELWSARPVIDGFFNLVHVLNKGAVFGFLNRSDIDWQRGFFICATLLAMGVIFYLAKNAHEEDRLFFKGLGMILGGAIGNLIDRIHTGMVVDFLDFYIGDYHWPAFNVADIGISLGAFSLLVSLYAQRKNTPPENKE